MSDKEKGKSHPFAGHLRPTEEILWMSTDLRDSAFWQMAWTAEGRAVISMIVFAVGILLMIGLALMPPPVLALIALAVLILSTAPVLVIWGVRRAFKVTPNTRVAYAVTNERLLYRSEQTLLDVPLEKVKSIPEILRGDDEVALGFVTDLSVPMFPTWSDVKNPLEVKTLIEEARDKRLKELAQ